MPRYGTKSETLSGLQALSDQQLRDRLRDEFVRDFDLRRETGGRLDCVRSIGHISEECRRRGHTEWYGCALEEAKLVLQARKDASDRARQEVLKGGAA